MQMAVGSTRYSEDGEPFAQGSLEYFELLKLLDRLFVDMLPQCYGCHF